MARVLIVDDDAQVLELLKAVLRCAGYDVTVAASAIAALELLHSGSQFDLMLTDIAMPDLNGFSLALMVHPRRPTMKLLYLTGYHDRDVAGADEALRLGKRLAKPVSVKDLRNAVSEALASA